MKIWRFLTGRFAVVSLLLLAQAALLIRVLFWLGSSSLPVYWLLQLVSVLAVLLVVSGRDDATMKLAWSILLLTVPLVGGALYLLARYSLNTRRVRRLFAEREAAARVYMPQAPDTLRRLETEAPFAKRQAHYLARFGFPVCEGDVEYLSPGEAFHARLLGDLASARRFIFLEFFIVEEGAMWQSILDVLTQKAAEGVEVRLLYDDFGCVRTLPSDYHHRMEAFGIACRVFNPYSAALAFTHNNRDHRKIAVIDGRAAYTGGVNLADEYINARVRFGFWKDAMLRVGGGAVRTLTDLFLTMWNASQPVPEDFAPYLAAPCVPGGDLLIPYGDSPFDGYKVSESIYLQIIQGAHDYVYIATPYLIIDDAMIAALQVAAESGVDVRVLTPHIPDKWYVHTVTRSFYPVLHEAGVHVYEYTPGFIHSKLLVSDDRIGLVGSANCDFRSFCHHFEGGVLLVGSSALADIKADFLADLAVSAEIVRTPLPWYKRLMQRFLRLFAPLL